MILYTEEFGDGEPIIFLHTGLQSGKTELTEQKDYFMEKYKVILPDLRGHGKSVADDLNDYFNLTAQDLFETMRHLEVESSHIVGCSIGALVGLTFAKRYPNNTKSLTLSGIMPEKPNNWIQINEDQSKDTAKILKDPNLKSYFDQIHEGNWTKLLGLTRSADWYPFELTKDLNTIGPPTLYIVGENNPLEVSGVIKYSKNNEQIHVAVIPYAGHNVHLEQPDIYNAILKSFLHER